MNYIPGRGDVVWLDFDPQAGHEQAGRRLALALSPLAYNRVTGLMICCPLTTAIKGYPFEVATKIGGKRGVVLADHVKNLDWRARRAERKATIEPAVLAEVLAKLGTLLEE